MIAVPRGFAFAALLLGCSRGAIAHPDARTTPAPMHLATLVHGALRYQHVSVRDDPPGLGPTRVVPAPYVPWTLRVDGHVLAAGETDARGEFRAETEANLTRAAEVEFTTAGVRRDGHARFAIAHSPGVWAWRAVVSPDGNAGERVVRVDEGSGALFAFELLALHLETAAHVFGPAPRGAQPSVLVLWEPGLAVGSVEYESDRHDLLALGAEPPRAWETRVYLDGTDATHAVWTPSLLGHELGHHAMDTYGILAKYPRDSERAMHELESPEVAWAEGWATFWAQTLWSRWQGREQARAVFENDGEFYGLDLRDGLYLDARHPELRVATLHASRDAREPIADAHVATALWNLRDTFGERAVLALVATPRMTLPALDRGARGLDLLDALDALACASPSSTDAMRQLVRARIGFVYDGRPRCPSREP